MTLRVDLRTFVESLTMTALFTYVNATINLNVNLMQIYKFKYKNNPVYCLYTGKKWVECTEGMYLNMLESGANFPNSNFRKIVVQVIEDSSNPKLSLSD